MANTKRIMWDAAIVGAGPAGATAAAILAKRGHSVVLVDKCDFPRDKTCGDGLLPDAIQCLGRLGLINEVKRRGNTMKKVLVYGTSEHIVPIDVETVTLKRFVLDEMIVDAAVHAGAVIRKMRVQNVREDETCVTLEGDSGAITAKIAMIATGADTTLAKSLGLIREALPSASALRCYVRSDSKPVEDITVSYDKSVLPGYGWIFPLGNGEYNIGCGYFRSMLGDERANLRSMLDGFLRNFEPAKRLVPDREKIVPRGGSIRCAFEGTHKFNSSRTLAFGETIGASLPYTAEGIGKAMQTAEIAAETVAEFLCDNRPEVLARYEERLLSEIAPKFRGYKIAERWLSKRWLNTFITARAAQSAWLRSIASDVLNERADPAIAFSVSGVLRSFFA